MTLRDQYTPDSGLRVEVSLTGNVEITQASETGEGLLIESTEASLEDILNPGGKHRGMAGGDNRDFTFPAGVDPHEWPYDDEETFKAWVQANADKVVKASLSWLAGNPDSTETSDELPCQLFLNPTGCVCPTCPDPGRECL